MPLNECSPPVRIALGLVAALHRLDFPSSIIFFSIQGPHVAIVIRESGQSYGFRVGAYYTGIEEEWKQACKTWNNPQTPQADKEVLFVEFLQQGFAPVLMMALVTAGLYPRSTGIRL